MQWYLASLLILLTLVGIGFLVGGLVLTSLPWRMQPGARVFLGVPLGWAVLTLVVTLVGWIGPGYAHCHCALVTAALAVAGAWAQRTRLRKAGPDCLRLAGFCMAASLPVLAPLIRTGAFTLYGDAFLYDSQAQWLQSHAFMTTAQTRGGHPVWQSVVFMQEAHLRMGAAFLLGWVQATFGLDLSLDAFPAVAALGLVCGALGVGATVLSACPGRWPEAWLAALAVATTVNGFGFGATNGFLAQTWGLGLFSAAFGLRGLELGTRADQSGCPPSRTGVPVGLCAAAALHCYWDLLPLAGPALACTYLLPWPGHSPDRWRRVWRQARAPLLTCLLLMNLEWGRAAQGIWLNIHAVVANPVAWPVLDFPAHALGFKSSVWERGQWITHSAPFAYLLAGPLAVGGWLLAMRMLPSPARRWRWRQSSRGARPWRWQPLVPALVWSVLTVLLFGYFRYAVPSPWHGRRDGLWPDGVGQSWSQYKVTIWASCALIGLVVAAGVWLTRRGLALFPRGLLLVLLAGWCGTGLGWNFFLAGRRGDLLVAHSGGGADPLAPCRAMRALAAKLPTSDWIYLDWQSEDGAAFKYRELMAYFLCERSLASDWVDSPFLASSVSPEDAWRSRADCQWILRYRRPTKDSDRPVMAPGGMTLERVER